MTGRPRKPLAQQKGHLKVITMQQKKMEDTLATNSRNQLNTPPAYLANDIARREWRRVVKNIQDDDLLGNLDRQNLIGYCNAYAGYVESTKQLKGAPFTIETAASRIPNPLIKVQTNYASEMRRFAALCGLTIDARLRAATVKIKETQDNVEAKFGAI